MMNLPLQRPAAPTTSLYELLGFKDLPFPTTPVVDPYNKDDRRNGRIYAEAPVQAEIQKFERLLIRPNDFANRARMATLWAKGDTQSGRGMGKTALLRFFQQRINADWGVTEFGGRFSALVVYVAFPDQVDRRYIEQLAWAALVDTCQNDVLKVSRFALRRNMLSDDQVAAVVNANGVADWRNLLNDALLQANGISAADLDNSVEHQLINDGVERGPARALAMGTFEDYLRDLRRDRLLRPYYVQRDTKGLEMSRTLFFDDIVRYLRSAGFAGGYLFVDDIENLTDQMPRRHRTEFAKELAQCTVRPAYANGEHDFFSCVLTTHQSSAFALSQPWRESGLAGVSRLDPDAPTSVELPLPTQDQAREIIIAHLDYFRINKDENGTIAPFTEAGMSALVGKSQHPRDLLANAALAVLHAADKGVTSIDADTIEEAMGEAASIQVGDLTEGIDEAL